MSGRNHRGSAGGSTPVWLVVLTFLWMAGLGCCLAWVTQYTLTPGPTGPAPAQWPTASQIAPDNHLPTLVLFAHPQCPCTRATLGELELIMARASGQLAAQVWFLKPDNTPPDWTNTTLWHLAAVIPGVSVHEDWDGREARRFRAGTSGQALLYDARGRLLFQGGITESRGHSGDNTGRSAITALVSGGWVGVVQTPVFGCSLFNTNCALGGIAWQP